VSLLQIRMLVTVPDEDMLPPPELFLHPSTLHGQAHVGRAMIHALRLIEATGFMEDACPLWAAVYLHDIARIHDGRSPGHGADAWERLATLPELHALFSRGGVRDEDLPAIRAAVTLHSRGEAEPGADHKRLTDLIKDADGLDRVRLYDLNPNYLRTPEARTMVQFAEQLYRETDRRIPPSREHFGSLWSEAQRILGERSSG
jgi:hypothetical protein